MNDPYAARKRLKHLVFYSVVAAVGGFLFGFDSAVINGTVNALQNAFSSSTIGTGFSVASMLIGCAAGALTAGTVADRTGRRPVMLTAASAFLISALGSGCSSSSGEFIIYRLLGGLAVGAASVIAPAYISEIAPASIRGRLTSLQQMAIVLGIFIALLCNYAIASASGGAEEPWIGGWATWSWMFWMEAIPSTLYFILLLFIPESPRFLIARQKDAAAKAVLSKVTDPPEIPFLVTSIKTSLHGIRKTKLSDLLKPASFNLLPVVWIGMILAALQQLSGINVIFYYGSVLWQAAGFSESNALFINVISGLINITSTVTAIVLIDRIGRKPLLLVGSLIMTGSLGAVALVFARSGLNESGSLILTGRAAWIALIGANIYVFGFGTTWGPCVWVLLSEMFGNRIRGSAMALATFILWMTNFTVTITFPRMLQDMGLGGAYLVFTGFALASFFFICFFVRETKGKTLEALGENNKALHH